LPGLAVMSPGKHFPILLSSDYRVAVHVADSKCKTPRRSQ
jgi:hypothetical protein